MGRLYMTSWLVMFYSGEGIAKRKPRGRQIQAMVQVGGVKERCRAPNEAMSRFFVAGRALFVKLRGGDRFSSNEGQHQTLLLLGWWSLPSMTVKL
jgi:hypothetical protein